MCLRCFMRKNPNKYEIREIRGKFVRVFCAVPEIRGIPNFDRTGTGT